MAQYHGAMGNEGGFWNPAKVEYSQGTHALLKEMMQESKLTNFQQRNLQSTLRGGGALPLNCNPTTSAKKQQPKAPPKPPKYLNPKNYSSNGVRKKEAIEQSGAYERPQYEPGPSHWSRDNEKEKERFAHKMAFGTDLPEKSRGKRKQRVVEPEEVKEIDRFAELQSEIDERREFLADMDKLGQGEKFRPIIETEISQKIREMEVIDKKKTVELERMMAKQDAVKARQSKS